jgi:hypothetical protein
VKLVVLVRRTRPSSKSESESESADLQQTSEWGIRRSLTSLWSLFVTLESNIRASTVLDICSVKIKTRRAVIHHLREDFCESLEFVADLSGHGDVSSVRFFKAQFKVLERVRQ